MRTVVDFETSRFPDAHPHRKSARAISWATLSQVSSACFRHYTDPDFKNLLQDILNATSLLIGINLKFDIAWAKNLGCTIPMGIRVWDCQLAEYVLSGQTNSFASMDELCLRYDIEGKRGGLEEYWNAGIETADIPLPILEEYNIGDVSRTLQIYEHQLKDERMTEPLKKLILLQGLDLLVLEEMERNGIVYDKEGSVHKGDEVLEQLEGIKEELQKEIEFEYFNLDSGDHLSAFLYGGVVSTDLFSPVTSVYKSGPRKGQEYTQNKFQETIRREFTGLFKPLPKTALKKQGMFQTGEPVLRQLPCRTKQQKRIIELLLKQAELSKQVGSFLHALPELMEKMEWGDVIYPTYNQCVARTGRLSCSKPNAQQWDEETSRFWISRYDCQL
jgi:DNA polymerase I-like protein with 3'-5' exonuclease and polymerase domains